MESPSVWIVHSFRLLETGQRNSNKMKSGVPQWRLLLWKNFVVKKRSPWNTLCEILAPVLVFALVCIVRLEVDVADVPESSNIPFNVPDVQSRLANLVYTMGCGLPYGATPSNPYSGGWAAQAPNQSLSFAPSSADVSIEQVEALVEFMQSAVQSALMANHVPQQLPCGYNKNGRLTYLDVPAYVSNGLFRVFPDQDKLQDYYTSKDYGSSEAFPPLYMAVLLTAAQPAQVCSYTVKMNVSVIPWAGVATNDLQIGFDESKWAQYYNNGFLTVQRLVDEWVVGQAAVSGAAAAMPDVSLLPFPTQAHQQDDFAAYLAPGIGLLLVLAFYWPFSRLVQGVVTEKQKRLLQSMEMMGLSERAFWISWVITAGCSLLLSISLLLVLTQAVVPVFPYSDTSLLLVFFFGYGMSTVFLGCLLSTFFSTAKMAGRVAPVVLVGCWLPYTALEDNQQLSLGVKLLASLLPPVAGSLGSVVLLDYEAAFIGLRWDNVAAPVQGYSMLDALTMLYLDCLLYAALAWFFNQVFPGEFGSKRPWYFLCTRRYWLGCAGSCWSVGSAKPPTRAGGAIPLLASDDRLPGEQPASSLISSSEASEEEEPHVEPVPASLAQQPGVTVRGLRKHFAASASADGEEVRAVDGLDLDMYPGQIFALLGHNGAGKTTTINMLTGLIPPTAGDAWLLGASVVEQLPLVRSRLGICPQHNVLWPSLTAVADAMEEVELQAKADDEASTLSGGQQRRLSLAIALIGDCPVVFLDEPTSGVDPASRRAIWDLLLRKKAGRVIVLTTHFMDEADQLGDRIGIMHQGKLKCAGSSLFLKQLYGVGYSLTFIMSPPHPPRVANALRALVQQHVPAALPLSHVGSELALRLPLRAAAAFPALLIELDTRKQELGLDSYGLSVTTLEEVFLKVAEDATVATQPGPEGSVQQQQDQQQQKHPQPQPKPQAALTDYGAFPVRSESAGTDSGHEARLEVAAADRVVDHSVARLQSAAGQQLLRAQGVGVDRSFSRHVTALLVKRFHYTKRDKQALCCQYLLPVLLMTIGLAILQFPLSGFFPYLSLCTEQYNTPNPVAASPELIEELGQALEGAGSNVLLEAARNNDSSAITTAQQFSSYLLAHADDDKQSRYGAFWQDPARPLYPAASASITLFTNISAMHGLPTFLNALHAALLRQASDNPKAAISVGVQAFEPTYSERQTIEAVNGIFASIVISLSFAFIPASFAAFVVSEREHNSKHLQLVSGVRALAYWVSMYLWDIANFLLTGLMCSLVLLAYNNPSFTQGGNFPLVLLLVLLYGLAIIPFTYCCTFAFKTASTAQGVMILLYIVGGIVLVILDFTLYIIPKTRDANDKYIRFLFRLLPNYCLGDAIFFMSVNGAAGGLFADSNWDRWVAGWDIIFLSVQPVLYFLLALLLEQASHRKPLQALLHSKYYASLAPSLLVHDADVARERERVQSGQAAQDIIQFRGLRKVFPGNKEAVKDLWFAVPAGQCFGFLGVNGAGKTTTLRMVTGDEVPTQGTATLNGLDLLSHPEEVRSMMGYCPQFDALHKNLTAVETLLFYGRIRGVAESQLGPMVDYLVNRLNLQEYAHRPAGTYSGGNRRKLSVAIALVGDPPVVFLDEPSTGIDPVSRRFMWDFIGETMAHRAVVLTTHSMEECEALCTRIAIIGSGELQCIGTSQHLKNIFGQGVQINLSTGGQELTQAREFVLATFPGAQEVECFGSKAIFSLSCVPAADEKGNAKQETPSLAGIFAALEQNKARVGIAEYAVGQTTLEQVFIAFAKKDEQRQQQATQIRSGQGLRYQEI
eukprot:g5382.t1